MTSGVLW